MLLVHNYFTDINTHMHSFYSVLLFLDAVCIFHAHTHIVYKQSPQHHFKKLYAKNDKHISKRKYDKIYNMQETYA